MNKRRLRNPHIGSEFDDDFEECVPPTSVRRTSRGRKYIKPSATIEAEALVKRGPTILRELMQIHADVSDMTDPKEIGFYNGMAHSIAVITKTRPKYWRKK